MMQKIRQKTVPVLDFLFVFLFGLFRLFNKFYQGKELWLGGSTSKIACQQSNVLKQGKP